MIKIAYTGIVVLAIVSSPAMSEEFEVGQKNKDFTIKELKIKVGDSVKFTNQDSFYHNIYSLSDIKTFDLGSFPKGESRTVKFDKVGKIPVECAIHPNMYMDVIVE